MSKLEKFGGILLLALTAVFLKGCFTPPPANFTVAPQLCDFGCQPDPGVYISGYWVQDTPQFGQEHGDNYSIPLTYVHGKLPVDNGRAPANWSLMENSGACDAKTAPATIFYQKDVSLSCFAYLGLLTGGTISPDTINTYSPPATYTVTASGMSTQYGMPVLQYYDTNGNLVAQATGSWVSQDGTQMTGTTPSLSGVANGFYEGVVSNAGPNGTYGAIAAVGVTIYTPAPPPFNGSAGLGNGQSLQWYYTSSSGTCGPYNGTYTVWSFSYLTYVDSSGYSYPLTGGASYIWSSQPQYCPPIGPQPATLPLGYTGANNNIMINFTAGYGGAGSATITEQ
jgi:hypothetical protein